MPKLNLIVFAKSKKQEVVYLPADDQYTILHHDYARVMSKVQTNRKGDPTKFELVDESFKYGWEFPNGDTIGLQKMPPWKKVYAEVVAEL